MLSTYNCFRCLTAHLRPLWYGLPSLKGQGIVVLLPAPGGPRLRPTWIRHNATEPFGKALSAYEPGTGAGLRSRRLSTLPDADFGMASTSSTCLTRL